MKNNIFTWLVIAISLALLIVNCNDQENGFTGRLDSIAAGDSIVYVDSTFTVEFEAQIGEISGFGCHVVYDSSQITFLSSEKFNVFEHELIALQNDQQGRLIIGFNQFDCQNSIKNDTVIVFTVTFHVKIDADEGVSPVYFENKEAKLCDQNVASEWQGLDIFIRQINRFVMRMRIK